MGRRAVEGALRVPVAGSVQSFARPGDGARVPRRDLAGGGREARALLLDVRTEVLLDGADAAGARLREGRDGGEVARVPEERRALRRTALSQLAGGGHQRQSTHRRIDSHGGDERSRESSGTAATRGSAAAVRR